MKLSYSSQIEKEVLKNYTIQSPSKLPLNNKKSKKKFFNSKEKLKQFKLKTFYINSGQSLLLDSNMAHRSGPSFKNNESIRYTIVARYKSINKILNISSFQNF